MTRRAKNSRTRPRQPKAKQRKKQRGSYLNGAFVLGAFLVVVIAVSAVLLFRGDSQEMRVPEAEAATSTQGETSTSIEAAASSAQVQAAISFIHLLSEPKEGSATKDANPYAALYYYESDKQARYEKYAKKHDGLSADEVVWQVNVDLDKPDFDKAKKVKEPDGTVILVNKHFRLSSGFVPSNLVSVGGSQMTKATAESYKKLSAAASRKGLPLTAMSAYRSYEHQKGVHQRYANRDGEMAADKFSARAGYSEHQTGRAIDLITPGGKLMAFRGTPQCTWVHKNAWKYGFIIRYPESQTDITRYMYESWHITYVGEEAARTMHDEKISTLEEYVVKYVDHTPPVPAR